MGLGSESQRGFNSDPAYAHQLLATIGFNVPFGPRPTGIFVGTGGDVEMVLPGPDINGVGINLNLVYKNVPSGTVLPVSPLQINAGFTTAADIILVY